MSASIRRRFTLVNILMIIVPVLLMGSLIMTVVLRNTERRIRQEQAVILESVRVQAVERHLNDMAQVLQTLARNPDLPRVFTDPTVRAGVLRDWALVVTLFPSRSWVYYGDVQNRLLVQPEWEVPKDYDLRRRPWYSAARSSQGIAWVDPYAEYSSGEAVYTASVAIRDDEGRFRGVLAIDTLMSDFIEDLRRESESRSHALLLVTDNGRVVDLRNNAAAPQVSDSRSIEDSDADILASMPQGAVRYVTMDGVSYLATAAHLTPLPLKIVSLTPRRLITADLSSLAVVIGVVTLVALVVVASGTMITGGYVVRNIRNLDRYASCVSTGNLIADPFVSGNDEFRTLKQSIRRMVDTLARQIEQQEASNRLLDDALTEKEQLVQLRTSLIRVFGHNATTPITLLLQSSDELLTSDPESEELQVIKQSAWELKWLTENIMTYLRINEGSRRWLKEDVSMTDLTRLLVNVYTPLALRKELRIHAEIAENCTVRGDYFLIRVALENLLDNAIKYSFPHGELAVYLERSNAHIRWFIQDNGPGFTTADRTQLFGRFQTLSARPTGGESSTGLGLYIVREVLRHLGGEVRLLDASADGGACFQVTIPAQGAS